MITGVFIGVSFFYDGPFVYDVWLGIVLVV